MTKSIVRNGGRRRGSERKRVDSTGKSASLPRRLREEAQPVIGSRAGGLQPAIRVVMMPRDANYLGTIFGGVILSSLDLAGVVEAHQHSDRNLVTAAMREVKFIAPVFVGDLVSFYTEAIKIGRTSITVRVTVEATRALAPHETARVTQAEVVYVAIGDDGKPIPVKP
jgi:acyl-CoA thioesterase YciA